MTKVTLEIEWKNGQLRYGWEAKQEGETTRSETEAAILCQEAIVNVFVRIAKDQASPMVVWCSEKGGEG